MTLSEDQIKEIRNWVSQGQSLSKIQKLLKETFDIHLTYMDVRLLIDDLNITLKDKESSASPKKPSDNLEATAEATPTPGKVSVSVDKITRPNTLASGQVTLSDGVQAAWQLDQTGRIGLIPPSSDYQPSPNDLQAFQEALHEELQKVGF